MLKLWVISAMREVNMRFSWEGRRVSEWKLIEGAAV